MTTTVVRERPVAGAVIGTSRRRISVAEPRRGSPLTDPAVVGSARHPSTSGGVRLTRRGRVVLVLVVLAVAFAAMTLVVSPAASTEVPHHATAATVVVRPGDTLWDIATRVKPGADPRDVVSEILDLNNLSDPGALRAGQLLYLPQR